MSEETWSDGVSKTRSALGDVTNLVGKRGYALISKSGVKTGDDHKKDGGLGLGKKECRTIDFGLRPHSRSQSDSLKENVVDGIAKIPCDTKEPGPPGVRQNVDSNTTARSSYGARLSTLSSPTRLSDRGVLDANSRERVETSISNNINDVDDLTSDNLDFIKEDYLDCSRLLESQESRSSGLERSIGQKSEGCSSTGLDSIKDCSCSFCMKAAYIWSDLHYQDIKGRIAAIKKSQKEASILVQRNSRNNEINKYGQGRIDKFSKMESDLTHQWRSFFLHMEDIFAHESSQLESSLSTLRDLRDNCKIDLEPMDGMHSEKK